MSALVTGRSAPSGARRELEGGRGQANPWDRARGATASSGKRHDTMIHEVLASVDTRMPSATTDNKMVDEGGFQHNNRRRHFKRHRGMGGKG